jgi:poly(3-hydroxybutyrate) depolymerase
MQLGFSTYSFEQSDGSHRCFTVYLPPDGPEGMPVLLLPKSDGDQKPDKSMLLRMQNALGTRGIASVFVPWQEGGSLNTANAFSPEQCTPTDVEYGSNILSTLTKVGSAVDMDAIYIAGFSANSYFATLLTFCLSDRIRGVMAAGGPMAVYPCRAARPLRVCLAATNNDPKVADDMNDDSYKLARDEGHIVTNIVWDNDGGHSKQTLWNEWIVSCLQILKHCTRSCWAGYLQKRTCTDCSLTKQMLMTAVPEAQIKGTPGSFASPGAVPAHAGTSSKCLAM